MHDDDDQKINYKIINVKTVFINNMHSTHRFTYNKIKKAKQVDERLATNRNENGHRTVQQKK